MAVSSSHSFSGLSSHDAVSNHERALRNAVFLSGIDSPTLWRVDQVIVIKLAHESYIGLIRKVP